MNAKNQPFSKATGDYEAAERSLLEAVWTAKRVGYDQIVLGWRAMHTRDNPGEPGIKLFTPLDGVGKEWRTTKVSGTEVAVEDIKAADLDGNGKPDIVAAARQTKNLKVFFSE